MSSIRLPAELEEKLQDMAELENTTKSEILKRALKQHLDACYQTSSPFELGKDLFGRYGSHSGALSRDYKTILKEKLRAKHAH